MAPRHQPVSRTRKSRAPPTEAPHDGAGAAPGVRRDLAGGHGSPASSDRTTRSSARSSSRVKGGGTDPPSGLRGPDRGEPRTTSLTEATAVSPIPPPVAIRTASTSSSPARIAARISGDASAMVRVTTESTVSNPVTSCPKRSDASRCSGVITHLPRSAVADAFTGARIVLPRAGNPRLGALTPSKRNSLPGAGLPSVRRGRFKRRRGGE